MQSSDLYANIVTFDVPLPSNVEIESAVLGSFLLSGDVGPGVGILNAYCFSREPHRELWALLEDMYGAGEHVDRLSVYTRAQEKGFKNLTLGYLIGLDEDLPQIYNLGEYIQILKDIGIRREAILGMQAMAMKLADRTQASVELLSSASQFIGNLESSLSEKSVILSGREIIEAKGGLEAYFSPEAKVPTVSTPWSAINEKFLGFAPGKLYLIAARPSVGKTAFALQCAWHAAANGDSPLFVSIEMGNDDLIDRTFSCQANVTMGRLHFRKFNNEDLRSIAATASSAPMDQVRFIDVSTVTVPMLRQWILQCNLKPRIVFVDYLQLMTPTGGRTRNDEVSIISRGLKVLARELDVAIVALSQLKRLEGGGVPGLQDLRDSGSLEQDADFVGFLHAPNIVQEVGPRETVFIISKQRNGSLGRIALSFDGIYQRFIGDGDPLPTPPQPLTQSSFLEDDLG